MKKIVLALTFVLVGSFMLAGCSKDEILNHYNNIVQSAGSIELTGKSSLQGEKKKELMIIQGLIRLIMRTFQVQSICSEELP
jgi:hypothetical protein